VKLLWFILCHGHGVLFGGRGGAQKMTQNVSPVVIRVGYIIFV
jgi:hypothetical protein